MQPRATLGAVDAAFGGIAMRQAPRRKGEWHRDRRLRHSDRWDSRGSTTLGSRKAAARTLTYKSSGNLRNHLMTDNKQTTAHSTSRHKKQQERQQRRPDDRPTARPPIRHTRPPTDRQPDIYKLNAGAPTSLLKAPAMMSSALTSANDLRSARSLPKDATVTPKVPLRRNHHSHQAKALFLTELHARE